MNPKYILLILNFIGIQSLCEAQSKYNKDIFNYFEDILYSAPGDQNHFFTAQYKYMSCPFGKTFNSQSAMANFGVNFARFFSKKIIFGLSLDLKLIPGFSGTSLSNEFINDFNANYISTYENSVDSINSGLVRSAINSDFGNLRGLVISNYGIMLSLFPQKYGGILFEMKYGYKGFHLRNVYGSPNPSVGGYDKLPITFNHWIYEITLKPFAFFRNSLYLPDSNQSRIGDLFVFSIFYERLNLKSGEFAETRFENMVSNPFMTKYGIDNRFGFKVGFAFY